MRKMIEYETGGRDKEATQPVRAVSKVGGCEDMSSIIVIFSRQK